MDVISIIMAAGKSSVDVALYTLLPIMVIMLIIMKYLEVRGILDVIVRWVAPLLKPFGLTGMSAFALIQINFVSFAAPLATLSIMDKRGVSDRQMAATLAMVFAMGQATSSILLPLLGLHWLASIVISVVGGLCAAAVAWHVTGRRLSVAENPRAEALPNAEQNSQGILAVINSAGSDAIRLALGAVPMLILSLTIVGLPAGRRGYRPAAAAAEAASQLAAHPPELCAAGAGEVRCRGHRLLWRHFRADPAGQSHRGPGQRLGRSTDPDL
ncbi:nucleoside recognition family protein [Klebsiella pneumoniae]|uniref:Nucleoside recognition family protein n=1 Tax=Klebsiella pneumoniae TaxID=573 RepID=A0A378AT25_KLEPN|nr:nucleoside recognition family protein [Klebsiella pneumoniae]